MPYSGRRDFALYVDEFQNFATDSFADILSEAAEYWQERHKPFWVFVG